MRSEDAFVWRQIEGEDQSQRPASIDDYLQNSPRIVGAVFPDQRKRRKLNDEEWSVQLLPIQFLFLSASPVIVMRFVRKSGGKEYPPNVPIHATSLLLMEVQTDYKLNGLDSNSMPSHLALTVRGLMYPQREGRKSLRGHVEMTVGFNLRRCSPWSRRASSEASARRSDSDLICSCKKFATAIIGVPSQD
ncbi:hypothetical protein HU200_003138 [Digitaria exilis]|uniref:Uncharacterized protein n=1 Tax=Digitaria exilis TaxID=1010633 RepID=A0A835FUY3_9POAL|nr:hypothetical protein HU200_003138 [Digitaria exilis]